jgi:hypothetical protein
MNGKRRPGVPGLLRVVFRRDRLTGQVAIGLVGVLGISAVVFGVGMASAKYRISDIGAWLSASEKGMVVHANGLAGKVDGKTNLIPNMRGHEIKIVQDGSTILIVDQRTGVVSRIDPAQLKVGQSRAFGASGLQVVIGHGAAYTVDPAKGTVQQIDPVTLSAVGQEAALTAPLGQAAIDGKGTLWVPTPANGQVVPFQAGRQAGPVTVGRARDALAITVAAGAAVVTNSTAATATVVDTSGPKLKVALPSTVSQAGPGGVLFPATTDGQVVPLLARRPGVLVLVNSLTGGLSSVTLKLTRNRFGSPQMLGSKVYIPDETLGRLHIYNSATNRFEAQVPVTGRQGPLEVFVKDGMLWVNDPGGEVALALDSGGIVKRISKYDTKVPGGPRRPIPTQGPPGGDRGNPNGGGDGNGGDQPAPQPTRPVTTPAPWEAPTEPINVMPQGGDGQITVSFQPSVGGKPTGYVLKNPQGLTVSPTRIRPDATDFTFTLRGGDCGKEYTFNVAVQYKDQSKRAAEKLSAPSPPARPCTAPGQPSGFNAAPVNHGANLTWQATAGRGVTYTVTGPGGATVSGTTHVVGGLRNGQSYTWELVARNGAGNSPPMTTSATLDPERGAGSYGMHWHNDSPTIIRPAPNRTGDTGARIPQSYGGVITVHCQVRGEYFTDTANTAGRSGGVWNKITYNGTTGWISDLFVKTANSDNNAFSPPLWECE